MRFPQQELAKVLRVKRLAKDFEPEPAHSTNKGKHIVLCFWDINQQQSQQVLLALRNRQKILAEQGVSLIAVEASGATMDKIRSWAKENSMTFPVGASYGLYEWFVRKQEDDDSKPVLSHVVSGLKIAWRIDRLPWLILTDREHIVTAEGFALPDLDQKISDAEK